MKTLIPAAIRCSLMFTAVAALSLAYPASVQAVPTTYQYTGNHFTDVSGPYTTSDFVTAIVTLAGPLGANMPLTTVTPTAFALSDGVQTISNRNAYLLANSEFATGPTGAITHWVLIVIGPPIFSEAPGIATVNRPHVSGVYDAGNSIPFSFGWHGFNERSPGRWAIVGVSPVPDTGSTLSLLTLTLMALSVAARQFKRGAA